MLNNDKIVQECDATMPNGRTDACNLKKNRRLYDLGAVAVMYFTGCKITAMFLNNNYLSCTSPLSPAV